MWVLELLQQLRTNWEEIISGLILMKELLNMLLIGWKKYAKVMQEEYLQALGG